MYDAYYYICININAVLQQVLSNSLVAHHGAASWRQRIAVRKHCYGGKVIERWESPIWSSWLGEARNRCGLLCVWFVLINNYWYVKDWLMTVCSCGWMAIDTDPYSWCSVEERSTIHGMLNHSMMTTISDDNEPIMIYSLTTIELSTGQKIKTVTKWIINDLQWPAEWIHYSTISRPLLNTIDGK